MASARSVATPWLQSPTHAIVGGLRRGTPRHGSCEQTATQHIDSVLEQQPGLLLRSRFKLQETEDRFVCADVANLHASKARWCEQRRRRARRRRSLDWLYARRRRSARLAVCAARTRDATYLHASARCAVAKSVARGRAPPCCAAVRFLASLLWCSTFPPARDASSPSPPRTPPADPRSGAITGWAVFLIGAAALLGGALDATSYAMLGAMGVSAALLTAFPVFDPQLWRSARYTQQLRPWATSGLLVLASASIAGTRIIGSHRDVCERHKSTSLMQVPDPDRMFSAFCSACRPRRRGGRLRGRPSPLPPHPPTPAPTPPPSSV